VEPYIPLSEELPQIEGPLRIPGLQDPAARARVTAPPIGGPRIRGTVRLGDGATPAGGGILFVIARPPTGGPPLAVRRLPPGPFPIEFELGPEDSMMQVPLNAPVILSARLDADGDPMTRAEEDLAGQTAGPVSPGASGVELVLGPPGPS
jgi:hypothetical protein